MSIISLQATATTIREVFSKAYIIPRFQRSYTWDKENCDDLWSDIMEFHKSLQESAKLSQELQESSSQSEPFFLGSIVLYGDEDNWCIIDGQQRLTTLMLLIKALFERSIENKSLAECLWQKNLLTGDIDSEKPRIESRVIENDRDHMDEILASQGHGPGQLKANKSTLHENYLHLSSQIDKIDSTKTELGKLILTILDKVVLLPIRCSSRSDALKIFKSINNRGKQLEDSDIFKSEIYGLCPDEEKDQFINRWNKIDDPMYMFRLYMYIHRANHVPHQEKEKGLLPYFEEDRFRKLKNYSAVMSDIEKISIAHEWLMSNSYWWYIMDTSPNHYWKYPLFVFLNKHGRVDGDGLFHLDDKHDDFVRLEQETAKYCFIRGIVHNAVNRVKPAILEACSLIAKDEDYVKAYKNSVSDDRVAFSSMMTKDGRIPSRYVRGMVLIGAMCNPNTKESDFFDVISKKYNIEHILPKQWKDDYYGDWDDEKSKRVMDTFGNLMPLEKKINIKAGNNFFGRKKEHYKKSKIQDAIDLSDSSKYPSKNWSYDDYAKRHEKMLERFEKFFKY